MSSMNVAFSLSSLRFDINISRNDKDEKKELENKYYYEKRLNSIIEENRTKQANYLLNPSNLFM